MTADWTKCPECGSEDVSTLLALGGLFNGEHKEPKVAGKACESCGFSDPPPPKKIQWHTWDDRKGSVPSSIVARKSLEKKWGGRWGGRR